MSLNMVIEIRTKFKYKRVYSNFDIIDYVAIHKIIYMFLFK